MDDIPPGPGHETTDIGARSVAWFGMWLAGALALVLIAVAWMDKSLNHASAVWPRQPMQARPQFEPPGPPLQSSPVEDLHAHAAAEDALLHSYGWVDRKQSVVRIPIER
ncbi:MAG: hypothetical protein JWO94_999, partial [Verrucomicrobiaceae bacterium]|nr:hypothetical protein [Verrucomicrobiaceae bacterium]